MILGASRWLELNAPTAARRLVAIAATRARIRTAGLRIAHSLLEIGVEQFCAPGLRADVKLPARGSQQGSSVRLMREHPSCRWRCARGVKRSAPWTRSIPYVWRAS